MTPGEVVEANFGESPFVFNLEGLLTVSDPSGCGFKLVTVHTVYIHRR